MRTDDGGLLRSYRKGKAEIDGFLNDYAFLIHGLLALHEASGDKQLIEQAKQLTDAARTRFRDEQSGGYFDTLADQSDLFVRAKTTRDGAVPSGNSIMLHNLLDLHAITGEKKYLDDAADTLAFLSARLKSSPTIAPLATLALHRMVQQHSDYLPGGGEADAQPVDPVSISVNKKRIDITMRSDDTFEITLNIDDGFHINAHEPGLADLIGVDVRAVGPGIKVETTYPPGESYENPLFDSPIRVHSGSVTIPVTVQQVGAVRGRPRFMIIYQVCTDKVCYKPQRRTLPIRVNAEPR
jgi:hypothetical protein